VTVSCLLSWRLGADILNVICVYAPQMGLTDDIKKVFWEELEEVLQSIPQHEKIFLRGDFNGHIRDKADAYIRMHGRFGFGERNSGGVALLDFAVAFDLTIVDSIFKKKDEHLVTFRSGIVRPRLTTFLLGKTIGDCVKIVKCYLVSVWGLTIDYW